MINWYFFAVAACGLLLFLFYKEWVREKKSFLFGRLLASLLAVGSWLFMAYPYTEPTGTAANKLVLLTDGFVKDSLDQFLRRNSSDIPIFSVSRSRYAAKKNQLVTDVSGFAGKHAADTFHVFGDGFTKEQLLLLNDHPIVFHGNAARPGISSIYWKQQLEPGEQLVLQGVYENTGSKKVKMVLQAFGADKDSVFIDAGTQQCFELHAIPVHAGKAVYSLIAVTENDTLEKEPVPVETQAISPLQLLIIAASPDFDNTYLKNHLSRQGYQVTLATTISSNKTDKQYLNMPLPRTGSRLTLSYLNTFDVLMTDQETLQKISPAEATAIRAAIQENGMGLIIKMDDQHIPSFYSRFFPVKKSQQGKESLLWLHNAVADSNRYKIKITDPLYIGYTLGTQSILQDAQSNSYASCALYGSGKIIGITLQNTYSMALAGDKAAYQQLWWLLLHKAAKKIYPVESWRTRPGFSFVNQATQMQAEKTGVAKAQALAPQANIYLQQDGLLPFVWNGVYWPVEHGWQPLPAIGTNTGNWYVYNEGDWQGLVNYQRTIATKKYMALHPPGVNEGATKPAHLPVNLRVCLFIIFLIACIFLWVEQKAG